MPADSTTQQVNRCLDDLKEMAWAWSQIFPQAESPAQHWLKVLSQVQAHLWEDCLRVAVVGTVKAGKSTLVNALVGHDVLARGAGILTAMVTRVISGSEPQAVLRFKGWEEIHGEVAQSLGLLPNDRLVERASPLDLRNDSDRELLSQILADGETAGYWRGGSLNQDYLLLKAYLEGYPLVADYLSQGSLHTLVGPSLSSHQELVSRQATAVYLKDVSLTIPSPWLPVGLELGDCQGSDSPMPQHLAQVLTYLLRCDLVLYLVSSRVGLRQADFHFLGELKRLGLAPYIRFIINLDLTEHRNLEEINSLIKRSGEEISAVVSGAALYAFSALKLLFERRQERGEKLDTPEGALLSVWAGKGGMLAFSDSEAQRFSADFTGAIQKLRSQRLSGGSLAQARMVAKGLAEQLGLVQDLLSRDQSAFQELAQRLRERRQPLEATRHSIKQTLKGAGDHLKQVLKGQITGALDLQSGLASSLAGFIRGYEPDWRELVPPENARPFRLLLYQMFQEFQKEVSRFVAGEFTRQVLEFIRAQETQVRQELAQICTPLSLALQEALTLYYREIAALGLAASLAAPALEFPPPPQNLELPVMTFQVEQGWRWAGEAYVRSGLEVFKRAWRYVKGRLGVKAVTDPRAQVLGELQRALAAMQTWFLEQARLQVLDYGERLKFRYFFPLIDYYARKQEIDWENYLGSLVADLAGLAAATRQAEEERRAGLARLQELIPRAQAIERQLSEGYEISVE